MPKRIQVKSSNSIAIKLLTEICSADYEDDETNQENIMYIIEQFKECLPGYNINELKLVCKAEDVNNYPHVFALGDKLIGLKNNEWWFEVAVLHLSVESSDNDFGIKLIEDSDKKISYELYPFDQGDEISLESILRIKESELKKVKSKKCKSPKCLGDDIAELKYEWTDSMFLYICNEGGYYVVKDNKIISGFLDPETHFQLGDGSTTCYLTDNNDLVVENCGDVSSVVIIKKSA